MPFGSQINTLTPVFVERHFSASWGAQISQGQSWSPGITGFTMPFFGEILMDLWVQLEYGAGYLLVEVWPVTGGATNYWVGKVAQRDPYGGTCVCPLFGRWANFAQGGYFDLVIQIRDVVSNGILTIRGVHGSIRAQAY